MKNTDIIGLVITIIIGVLIVVMALVLLSGRGSFLIAGYNTSSKEEKEKYDVKSMCRFIGKILLPIGLFLPCIAIGGILKIIWLPIAYTAGVMILSIFAAVYGNTGNHFKKRG